MTTSEQQAVPVAQLQTLQDWLREPDHAEHFGTSQLVEWINRRPTHIVPAVLASLASHPCKSGEGAGEIAGWQHALDPCPATGAKRWIYAIAPTEEQARRDGSGAFNNRPCDVRPLYTVPDATQTREAECECSDERCEGFGPWRIIAEHGDSVWIVHGEGHRAVYRSVERAALNARGGV